MALRMRRAVSYALALAAVGSTLDYSVRTGIFGKPYDEVHNQLVDFDEWEKVRYGGEGAFYGLLMGLGFLVFKDISSESKKSKVKKDSPIERKS